MMGCTCKTDIFINYEFNVKSLSSCYWQKYLQTLHISFQRFKTLLSVSKLYWRYIFVIKHDTQLSNYAAYAFIWKLIVPVCIIDIVISPVALCWICVLCVFVTFTFQCYQSNNQKLQYPSFNRKHETFQTFQKQKLKSQELISHFSYHIWKTFYQ